MISKRAKHWLRRATTITLVVIVLGIGAATWYQSEQIENDLLHIAPRQLEYDLEVIAAGRGLVTLPAGPGTEASGRWGIEWESGYAALGEIVSTAPGTVTRELLEVSGNLVAGTRVALDWFAFENGPSTRGLEFEDVIVEGPLGNYPAWFTAGTDDTWVVLVHGRGSYRSEVLRLLPALAGAGYPTLTITYRNDLPAPESPNRHYGLGESEWPDLEAAVRYALVEGARDVVLVGYEAGAGIAAMFLHESSLSERAIGLVLDSPLLVPALRVDEAARAHDVPGFIVGWSKGLATLRFGIDWRGLDQVRRAEDFTVPILVLYGGGESEGSLAAAAAFAAARPGLVGLVRIPGAGPGEAWNFDAARYEAAVTGFLDRVASGRSERGQYEEE